MNILKTLLARYAKTPSRTIIGQPAALAPSIDASTLSGVLRSAESGSMHDFFALSRDVVSGHGHTQTEFGKRKLAVVGKPLKVTPVDEKDPSQETLCLDVLEHLKNLPSFLDALIHLLDSTLYPVSVVQKIYKPSDREGWRYELDELRPVEYHLLDFSLGRLRIQQTDPSGQPLGIYQEADPMVYIIHRGHLLKSVPDTWGGPMRAVLFWWLFATQDRDWWIRFLERFGAPFMVGKYDETSPESRFLLERAFSAATRLFGLAIPNDADVQIHQANATQGGDAFERFHKVANNEISKIILGQTSSSDVQSGGGLNSGGQASVQAEVRDDIRQYDSLALGQCIRTQLIIPLWQINGWSGPIPDISWGAEDNQTIEALSTAVERSYKSGLELDDAGLDNYNQAVGLTFRRLVGGNVVTPFTPPLRALSAGSPPPTSQGLAQSDRVAAYGATPLATAMQSTLSPIQAIIDSATSLSDLSAKLQSAFPTLDHNAAAQVAMLSLTANSLNAVENFPTLPN
jgi:phage gp29-like protein